MDKHFFHCLYGNLLLTTNLLYQAPAYRTDTANKQIQDLDVYKRQLFHLSFVRTLLHYSYLWLLQVEKTNEHTMINEHYTCLLYTSRCV